MNVIKEFSTINLLFGWIALKLPVRMPPCGVPSPSLLKATTLKIISNTMSKKHQLTAKKHKKTWLPAASGELSLAAIGRSRTTSSDKPRGSRAVGILGFQNYSLIPCHGRCFGYVQTKSQLELLLSN